MFHTCLSSIGVLGRRDIPCGQGTIFFTYWKESLTTYPSGAPNVTPGFTWGSR